ncbi:MAG: hypothetical protein GY847_06480 [Proteobacteria bacterium]|nr:hypothetical protein [Pseudomonadota bacterium]
MEIRIMRSDDTLTSQELKEQFEQLPCWDQSITLEVRQEQQRRLRTVDPTVLAAIFSAAGAALGALVTGLFQIAKATHKERVVLVSKDGLRIEIETRHALDKIPELIKLLRLMEVEIIRV